MVETENIIPISEKESIELNKTTKGYTWTIKIKENALTEASAIRLEQLDQSLKNKFGVAL